MKWLREIFRNRNIFRKIDDALTRYFDWLNLSCLYYEEIYPMDEETVVFTNPIDETGIEIKKCKTE